MRLLEPSRPRSIESLLSGAASDIERGSHLGESLRRRASPGQVPIEELRLIEVGEHTGMLPELLRRISSRLEERAKNRRIVVAGLIYPTILVHMAILAAAAPLLVSGLHLFLASVVPKFLVLWSLFLVATLLIKLVLSQPGGQRRLNDTTAQLPIVGRAIKTRAFSEYAYCVGVALSAGLPMPESITLGGEASHWTPLIKASRRIATAIGGGATMTQAHRRQKVMPKEIVESVHIGEKSGSLDETLEGASRMLGDIASRRTQAVAAGLPFVIYLLVAIYVGYVVLSGYLGLLKLPEGI